MTIGMGGEMLTVKAAAARLGLSPKTVYALCGAGELAHHKLGLGRTAIRIAESEVVRYLTTTAVPARLDGEPSAEQSEIIRPVPTRPRSRSRGPDWRAALATADRELRDLGRREP